jgi:alpha-glucan,water dikinase
VYISSDMITTETIATRSGLALQVARQMGKQEVELKLLLESRRACMLHWGLRVAGQAAWQQPPQAVWPAQTRAAGPALQTPFAIRLPVPVEYSSVEFVLFFPEQRKWDNNNGQNYRIVLEQAPREDDKLGPIVQEYVAGKKVLFQRVFDLEPSGRLAAVVAKAEQSSIATPPGHQPTLAAAGSPPQHVFSVAQASPPSGSRTVSVRRTETGGETPPEPAGEDACATGLIRYPPQEEMLAERKPSGGQLTPAEPPVVIMLWSDLPELTLHWGISRYSSYEWFVPPESLRPPGTILWEGHTAQTPFTQVDGLSQLRLEMPTATAPMGLQFVLKRPGPNPWVRFRGDNFFIPIRVDYERTAHVSAPELAGVAQEIIQAETARNSWTLMHRFNLAYDLLDRVAGGQDGLALIFVWLRYSALRQLTWQRNYNTKPRELSHAEDRLTQKLVQLYSRNREGRSLLRLMLASVGPGGEGQRIRDEILQIMHRHHIKEVAGHFLEEWHQKLHNNTTPDDIVICEAYLEFLYSDGNCDRFYQKLQAGGVNKQRLESFERPIRSDPDFVPHIKEGLIHDFQNFLRTLRSVHEGTDLETAVNNARGRLDGPTQGLLGRLWEQRHGQTPLPGVVGNITEIRRRLHRRLEGGETARELLYLDLALEQFLRLVVERNLQNTTEAGVLVELIARVLENRLLSASDAELTACAQDWQRLQQTPPDGGAPLSSARREDPGQVLPGRAEDSDALPMDVSQAADASGDWALHAKSVLDRIARVLGELIDRTYQLLQPKAELLGHAFHADAWVITLFSEEVVRGSSLDFALSLLLRNLEPVLRKAARLGDWQVVSRGSGSGIVEVLPQLRDLQGKQFDAPRVIVADHVGGDEDIPDGVTAVIAPDVTDIVSHVAVRARNAGLLFASCYDPETFNRLKALQGRHVRVQVNAAGDVVLEETQESTSALKPGTRATRPPVARPGFRQWALAANEFEASLTGAKSLNLTRLEGKLPGWIQRPSSVAIPFGVCEHVLAAGENQAVAREYNRLLGEVESDPARILPDVRATLLKLAPPSGFEAALRQKATQAGLPWPKEDWGGAWQRIKQVWASKWNERAFYSRKTQGLPHQDLLMAVLIQQVIAADYAFVLHTVNPFTGERDELYAELVAGLGETLVGNYPGRALSAVSHRSSKAITLLTYPSKSMVLRGGGLIFRSDSNGEDLAGFAGAGLYDSVLLPEPAKSLADYSGEPLVWDNTFRTDILKRLTELGVAVEAAFGGPQDIEGVVSGGKYFLVQSRPQVGIACNDG